MQANELNLRSPLHVQADCRTAHGQPRHRKVRPLQNAPPCVIKGRSSSEPYREAQLAGKTLAGSATGLWQASQLPEDPHGSGLAADQQGKAMRGECPKSELEYRHLRHQNGNGAENYRYRQQNPCVHEEAEDRTKQRDYGKNDFGAHATLIVARGLAGCFIRK